MQKLSVETREQARTRVSADIAAEIKRYQEQGKPNEVIGLLVMNALIEARLEIEMHKKELARLGDIINKEIINVVKTS